MPLCRQTLSLPSAWEALAVCIPVVLPFLECHINEIMQRAAVEAGFFDPVQCVCARCIEMSAHKVHALRILRVLISFQRKTIPI